MHTIEQLITPTPGVFIATIAVYLALISTIGFFAARRTQNLKDFFVMSGKAGTLVSGIAYFATQYSMSTFMGVPAIVYNNGFAGMSITVPGVAFSMLIPALFVGRRLMYLGRRNSFLTMTDYLSDRYQSSTLRVLHAVLMVMFLFSMMGAQMVGAGVIVKTFTGYPEWVGVIGMGTIVIIYCMFGGMRGAMLTDVLQGTLMVTTAITTFVVSVKAGGGLEAITAKLAQMDHGYLSHPGMKHEYNWGVYVSMILMWSFFTIGQPQLFTKFFAMRNYSVLFKSVLLGSLGMLISATLIEWSGANAIVSIIGLQGKQADFVVPMLLQKNLSPILASIMIAGIVAAGMATVSAYIVVATGGLSRDIYQKLINPQAPDEKIFRLSRVITVFVGMVGMAIGVYKPAGIFEIVRFAFGGLGIWVMPVILGMYWKRTTAPAAITGVILGELYFVSIKAGWLAKSYAFGLDPLIPSWLLAMAAAIVISLLTKPVADDVIERHFA